MPISTPAAIAAGNKPVSVDVLMRQLLDGAVAHQLRKAAAFDPREAARLRKRKQRERDRQRGLVRLETDLPVALKRPFQQLAQRWRKAHGQNGAPLRVDVEKLDLVAVAQSNLDDQAHAMLRRFLHILRHADADIIDRLDKRLLMTEDLMKARGCDDAR